MVRLDAIYARQSVDKADSISIESQIEYCRYEARGAPCRIYQDKGFSGKNTDRPGFRQMLEAIRKGEIRRVICYKLDRCSRSILDFATLMDEFQKYGVTFVSCTEKFDTDSPMGRAMLNICIVFAQLERETIQQRVSDAYHSRSKRGYYMGGKVPFGFRLEPYFLDGKKTSRYAINEEEAGILKDMYAIYENPLASLGDVITMLEESGIPHPRRTDGHWTRSHIRRLLDNPIYVKADLEVYRYFRENGVTIHNDPGDFIGTNGCYMFRNKDNATDSCHGFSRELVIAPHAGLIPSDVWLRCRRKHVHAGDTQRQYRIRNSWLAGKIKCAKCGYALVVQKTIKKSGKEFRYLICSNKGKDCSGLHGLRAEFIEGAVFSQMAAKLARFPPLPSLKHQPSAEETELSVRIARLEEEIKASASKALEADGPLMQYLSDHVRSLEAERSDCRRKMKRLKSPATKTPLHTLIDSELTDFWSELKLEDQLLLTDALIQRILIHESEMTIYWRI